MKIQNNSSSILKSFLHAFNGFVIAFKTQRNIRIEIVYLISVLFFSIFFNISLSEMFGITCSIILVIITELVNTSIEFLTDLVVSTWNQEAKEVKDLAASAVLLSAALCAVVTLFVFIPHVIKLI